ncbi:unnamed protein product, partial [Phaeothamnion confervicola]
LKLDAVRDLDAFHNEFQDMVGQLSLSKPGDASASKAHLEAMLRQQASVMSVESMSVGGGGGSWAVGGGGGSTGRRSPAGRSPNGREPPASASHDLRLESNMAYWVILKKKNDLQSKAARAQELQRTLKRILDATGLRGISDFVPLMLEAEEENFSLFKLINELNRELEQLEVKRSRVHNEAETLSHAARRQHQHLMKAELQQQIDRCRT